MRYIEIDGKTDGATYSNCAASRERRNGRHNQLFLNSKTTSVYLTTHRIITF
jgi:hypothetical protein